LWGLLVFAGIQMGLAAYFKRQHAFSDFEFDRRLSALKALIVKYPDSPLFLVLGSSRSLFGIRPELLAQSPSSPLKTPLIYNFSVPGGDPLQEAVYLKRLLKRGIRPQWLLIECWTICIAKANDLNDDLKFDMKQVEWGDLAIYRKCRGRSYVSYRDWLMTKIGRCYTGRDYLLARFAPFLKTRQTKTDEILPIDPWGWNLPLRWPTDPQSHRILLDAVRARFIPELAIWKLSTIGDKSMQQMLETCRQQKIKPIMLFMPESPEFRSLYGPMLRAHVRSYFTGLADRYSALWVDTNDWLDEAAFYEGFHLVPDAAAVFTKRLEMEVLPAIAAAERQRRQS
jgi:hypothetical protein